MTEQDLVAMGVVPVDAEHFPARKEAKRAWEWRYVVAALRAAGTVSGAADLCGMDRSAFYAMTQRSGRTLGEAREAAMVGSEVAPPRPVLVAVAVAWSSGGKLLCGLRCDRPLWELPGGKVEHGEQVGEAAAREVLEELGVKVVATGQLGLVVSKAGHALAFVRCEVPKHAGMDPKPGRAHVDAAWLSPRELMARPVMPSLVEFSERFGLDPEAKGITLR